MTNISFVGRVSELESLSNFGDFFFILVKGRRRIGKTLLLRKAFPDAVYIFVWPNKSIEWIIEKICSEYGFPQFKNFVSLLEYLSDSGKKIILDEFQNFLGVDRSVYGEIQYIIDQRKISGKPLKLAVAGSSYSLMNKIFSDVAAPLYGRRTQELYLDHLPLRELFFWIGRSFEDFVLLWSVFEGVPYYYELLYKQSSVDDNLIRLFFSKESLLQDEGSAIVSLEFGADSKTYSTILSTIAYGKTKLGEISGVFNNKPNVAVKYIDLLRKEFHLVMRSTPLTDNPLRSKDSRYEINDNFLSFWFLFIDRQRGYIEQERFGELRDNFRKNFSGFVGHKFEKFIKILIKQYLIFGEEFVNVGRQWGVVKNGTVSTPYEIDIVAYNDSRCIFCECKWQENIGATEIIMSLVNTAANVPMPQRNIEYALFAKSFKKKIKSYNGYNVYCYDLKDLEKILKTAKNVSE
jgi:AAA+ ATPase superfamily predicted ATPase